jgi:hypothetical protein
VSQQKAPRISRVALLPQTPLGSDLYAHEEEALAQPEKLKTQGLLKSKLGLWPLSLTPYMYLLLHLYLTLATAVKAIQLPSKTPLDYFKEIEWDTSLAQDRFFAFADTMIADQVRQAAAQGEFAPEASRGLFHPGATSSFKQVKFGETNVQLTFHENGTKAVDGDACVEVEPDIDYFQDRRAHTFVVTPMSPSHAARY